MNYEFNLSYAQACDQDDKLAHFRDRFYFPTFTNGDCLYFTGNSLGLQPKGVKDIMEQELEDWKKWGVEGHFHAKHPWFSYHEMLKEPMAELVGAKPLEVTAMNGLTGNLHFLMASFYRPSGKRTKIICEQKAFPSDQYALESQVRWHGLDPAEHLIEAAPEGHTIPDEKIIQTIKEHGDEVALVMIGGVNYYTGQFFDIEAITKTAHGVGAMAGWDLAHAAGNVVLELHDWDVDFAAWCSYKYLNSGPGSVSGIFVHEKHGNKPELPRLAGWWGYPAEKRFMMEPGFTPALGADGWQQSNAPVFTMAPYKVSLDMFAEAGMQNLREKGDKLTGYLEFVIDHVSEESPNSNLEIITPREVSKRGSQLSILAHGSGKEVFDKLFEQGVVVDWREPNVIRMSPAPMYNSFEDVYKFGEALKKAL